LERRGLREVGTVKESLASIMGSHFLRCSWQYRFLSADFNQSTTLESSAVLGCKGSLATICCGIKFFSPQFVVFFL
jgi:hypothetical protein